MSSVLRRYTPPTCTLEIAAKGSPLSRWTDRPVLKQVRFQLSFDDPKLPPEQQIRLRGDRAQLERLRNVVETYVQRVLGQSPDAVISNGNGQSAHLSQNDSLTDGAGIYLQPKGLVSHELHLGALATEESGSTVHLTALQLFDLANALDDYSTEAMALPSLGRPSWLRVPTGGSVRVAAIALLALGATATITKFVMDVASPDAAQTASTTVTQDASPSSPSASSQFPDAPSGNVPNIAALPDPAKQGAPPLGLQTLPSPSPGQGAPPSFPTVPVPRNAPVNTAPPRAAVPAPRPPQPTPRPSVAVPSQSTNPNSQAPVALSIPEQARTAQGSAGQSNAESSIASLQEVPEGGTDRATQQAAGRTAFDTIPQVAEVRRYFQNNWQPPDGLSETLEYRLVLNGDGSVQQILPLGETARTYVDRTNIPLINEPFVSPIENGQPQQIRVVLEPDGNVKTFLDPSN